MTIMRSLSRAIAIAAVPPIMIFLASPAFAEGGYRTDYSPSSCDHNDRNTDREDDDDEDEDREHSADYNRYGNEREHNNGLDENAYGKEDKESPIVRPVVGRITSPFGPRREKCHYGIDIAARMGTPILAVTDGVVEESGPATGFGLWVVLHHRDGTKSVYGHINRSFVEVGDRVSAGEEIAEVGNRGNSTGPHLHLEIWDEEGTKIDPAMWLARHGLDI